ncbi:MAG: HNH endonuclease [Solirubrobacteraceae bacterium]
MRGRSHTLLYRVYLRSSLWRIRRRVWILRAGGRCQHCGSRRRLSIHHRTYRRLGHERGSDIAVLCWRCHRQQHAPVRSRPAWRGWWPLPRSGYPPAVRGRRRPRTLRLALLMLIALPALVALGSSIPHR